MQPENVSGVLRHQQESWEGINSSMPGVDWTNAPVWPPSPWGKLFSFWNTSQTVLAASSSGIQSFPWYPPYIGQCVTMPGIMTDPESKGDNLVLNSFGLREQALIVYLHEWCRQFYYQQWFPQFLTSKKVIFNLAVYSFPSGIQNSYATGNSSRVSKNITIHQWL